MNAAHQVADRHQMIHWRQSSSRLEASRRAPHFPKQAFHEEAVSGAALGATYQYRTWYELVLSHRRGFLPSKRLANAREPVQLAPWPRTRRAAARAQSRLESPPGGVGGVLADRRASLAVMVRRWGGWVKLRDSLSLPRPGSEGQPLAGCSGGCPCRCNFQSEAGLAKPTVKATVTWGFSSHKRIYQASLSSLVDIVPSLHEPGAREIPRPPGS
jgi:hypothetical protein